MITQTSASTSLNFSTTQPFDQVLSRVKTAFKNEGFGTLTEIDVQRTLHEKIGEQIEPYTILGMCNPHLAFRAIKAEHEIGLLLPCNVLVHQCNGEVHVRAQDPALMMQLADTRALRPIGEEAMERIERAIDSLRQDGVNQK
jgi:uncharacterized protein (DUF302 family)